MMSNKKLGKKAALPKDTFVLSPSGYVKIQDLKIGDTVVCWDHQNNRAAAKPILETMSMLGNATVKITSTKNTFEVAPKTIVTLEDDTLMEAQHLLDYCEIKGLDNEIKTIIDVKLIEKEQITYNLYIEDFNNFFITEEDILVEGIQEEYNWEASLNELFDIQYS